MWIHELVVTSNFLEYLRADLQMSFPLCAMLEHKYYIIILVVFVAYKFSLSKKNALTWDICLLFFYLSNFLSSEPSLVSNGREDLFLSQG